MKDNIKVKVKKMYDDVVIPKQADSGSVGFDIHSYMLDKRTGDKIVDVKLHPRASYKVGTGLKVQLPEGYYMQIAPRSSAGVKKNLVLKNTVGIIDSSYTGEILLFIKNIGNDPITIQNGERLMQGIILPYPKVDFVEVDKLDETERGSGGFGSTGV